MMAFYSRFLDNFGTVSAPLYELASKGEKKFIWEAEHEAAFQALKKMMKSAKVLVLPKFDEPFYITSDASKVGLGGC